MAKVKLDLRSKNNETLRTFAMEHKAAMVGNVNFLTPTPTAVVFDASLDAYAEKLTAIAAAEIALQTLRAERDSQRLGLEGNLNARGIYVKLTSGGVEAKILSAAFQVQAGPTRTTSLPAPDGFTATMGVSPGGIDLSCHPIAKAKAYTFEYRSHPDTAAPGPWLSGKLSSRSSATMPGLTSGQRYAFRVRVLGPNDLESPWSAESACMAP